MASSMFALGMLLSTLALLLPSSMEKSIKPTPKPSMQIVAVCFLPKVEGLCTAYFPRFYFNQKTKKCEKFIYGGCGGNQNNFMTQQACLYKCAATTISSQLATGNKAANKTTVQQKTPKPIKQQAVNLNKPCEIDKKKALDNKYLFVPECDKNGDYKPRQCWKPPGVNTSCWCVDKKGSKIGEVKILPNGKETCNKTYTKPKQDSECFKLVKSYHENIPAENLAIMYIPQCDDYTGLYSPRQCHNNNCWCVNTLTGKLIKNSFGSKLTLKCPNA